MLRLGNDRQSVQWLTTGDGSIDRVLLRVIAPPYYTLLRALDPSMSGTQGAVRVYYEQATRIWVEMGYRHELANELRLPEGQILLICQPQEWETIKDEPFDDIYSHLNFELPLSPQHWTSNDKPERMEIPLRLVDGNAADVAEMWVIRDDAMSRLDAFVRDADDRLIQRLKFAVATDSTKQTVIVLRVSTSQIAPPVLAWENVVGFRPYHKLPNLYLPVGMRLHPTLRRDAVRELLADDPDQMVWLYPSASNNLPPLAPGGEGPGVRGARGAFTPERIPEDAFRPLEDWVEYVIADHAEALTQWMQSTRFRFDSFICKDGQSPGKTQPDEPTRKTRKRGERGEQDDDATLETQVQFLKSGGHDPILEDVPAIELEAMEAKPLDRLKQHRDALETTFLETDEPLDGSERVALWPQLARANQAIDDLAESTLCWLNALWQDDAPTAQWVDEWTSNQLPLVKRDKLPQEFRRLLAIKEPSPGEARQFALLILGQSVGDTLPDWLKSSLPDALRQLAACEKIIPIRMTWLIAQQLARHGGADTLGLARVRDRILAMLFEDGMRPERDMPSFLRFAGSKDAAQLRNAHEQSMQLYHDVYRWVDKSLKTQPSPNVDEGGTLAFTNLIFAYGLTRFNETESVHSLIGQAAKIFQGYAEGTKRRIAADFLLKAFEYRIQQATDGQPNSGPLPKELTQAAQAIEDASKEGTFQNNPNVGASYAISRLSEQLWVLEPQEKLDAYHKHIADHHWIRQECAALHKVRDPDKLALRVRTLLNGKEKALAAYDKLLLMIDALRLAARCGEQFAVELLEQVPEVMVAISRNKEQIPEAARKQGQLLEAAMKIAAHYDRIDLVGRLGQQFIDVVHQKTGNDRHELINVVATQCLQSLRKYDLRDEIDKLLRSMHTLILNGQTPESLKLKLTKADDWARALQSLLNLAGGWLAYGMSKQTLEILDLGRSELLNAETPLTARYYTPLVQAYISALGQGTVEEGLPRIRELFQQMPPQRVSNTFTSSEYFSRFHLNIVETAVRAMIGDHFIPGSGIHQLMEDDEFIVRRRIHHDMRQHLGQSGL